MEERKRLWEMIKEINFTMMTTVDEDGSLRSRPMSTQQLEFDGNLWFFTKDTSPKADEINQERAVNLSYANPEKDMYVSVTGKAQIVKDKEKAKQLWNPLLKAWFPDGIDDPELALIKVEPQKAEYWDVPSSTMIQLFGMAKAAITGTEYDDGTNKKVNLQK